MSLRRRAAHTGGGHRGQREAAKLERQVRALQRKLARQARRRKKS